MAEFSKINISNALNLLGIKNNNQGTSTGQQNFGKGDLINSYSPVDGSLIGSVSSSSKKDYEKAMDCQTWPSRVRVRPYKHFKQRREQPGGQFGGQGGAAGHQPATGAHGGQDGQHSQA